MRMLRFVGPGTDPDRFIVETEDGSEQYCVKVTAELRAAVRSDLPRLTPLGAPLAESRLSPRDIQTRVRGGESPESVAEESGLSMDNVLRFAAPVLDERARVASEARRARARRNGGDGPLVVFGEAVDARFSAHGIDPATVTWDAHRREDGHWVVTAHWLGGDAQRTAEWVFSLSARAVTAIDDAAFDLLSDRPVRPVAPPPVFIPHLVVNDGPAEPVHPSELPRQTQPAQPAESGRPARERVDIVDTTLDTDIMPSLPLGIAEPAAVLVPRRREESDEDRAERARIPSWDDILLGVRRKRD